MIEKMTAGMSVAWLATIGAVGSWMSNAQAWITLVCAVVTLAGTIFSLLVGITTLKLRRREYRDRVCADCRTGNVPVHCPVPATERPSDCLRKHP